MTGSRICALCTPFVLHFPDDALNSLLAFIKGHCIDEIVSFEISSKDVADIMQATGGLQLGLLWPDALLKSCNLQSVS